jgi:high-affinity iron transporter
MIKYLLPALLCLFACSAENKPRQDGPKEAHLLMHLLFYLEADAPRMEQSDPEWTQHKIIANDLKATAESLAAPEITSEAISLKELIDARAPTKERQTRSAAIQSQLIKKYSLLRSPEKKPNRNRGESLFVLLCADCHGKDGKAQTRRASQLKTPPASLVDPAINGPLSPYRVFNFLRFGLGEMPSFELSSEEDRWELAFYIFTLRAQTQSGDREIVASLPSTIPKTFDALSLISNHELQTRLQEANASDVEGALRALRSFAPYQ